MPSLETLLLRLVDIAAAGCDFSELPDILRSITGGAATAAGEHDTAAVTLSVSSSFLGLYQRRREFS